MKIRSIIVAVSLALASTTAFAFSCPKHMKAIDAALAKSPKLSAEQMKEVKEYRSQGAELHLGCVGEGGKDSRHLNENPRFMESPARPAGFFLRVFDYITAPNTKGAIRH